MSRKMSRDQRRAVFLEKAAQMFAQLEDWYDQHPDATFGEIEVQARQSRRALMGEALTLMINGRSEGYALQPPACPQCGAAMVFQGYRRRTVRGLEGDTELSRAYYTCSECQEQAFFPPGPSTPIEEGPLE